MAASPMNATQMAALIAAPIAVTDSNNFESSPTESQHMNGNIPINSGEGQADESITVTCSSVKSKVGAG